MEEKKGWYFATDKYVCPHCDSEIRPGQIHLCLKELGVWQSEKCEMLPFQDPHRQMIKEYRETKLKRGLRVGQKNGRGGVVVPRKSVRYNNYG